MANKYGSNKDHLKKRYDENGKLICVRCGKPISKNWYCRTCSSTRNLWNEKCKNYKPNKKQELLSVIQIYEVHFHLPGNWHAIVMNVITNKDEQTANEMAKSKYKLNMKIDPEKYLPFEDTSVHRHSRFVDEKLIVDIS